MTDINPSPELVQQWREQAPRFRDGGIAREDWLMTRAAQWGADQELKACCEWLDGVGDLQQQLRADRRPKPSSMKDRALKGLAKMIENGHLAPDLAAEIRAVVEMAPDA